MKRYVCSLAAAGGILLTSALAANASAAFAVVGGTSGTLPADFYQGSINAAWSAANSSIGPGTAVTYFFQSTPAGQGLFINPNNSNVNLTYTYEGFSASFVDHSSPYLFSTPTGEFTNQTTPVGTSYTGAFDEGTQTPPGLVPFAFSSSCTASKPCLRTAANGGPISDIALSIAYDIVSPTVAYAFLDDSQRNASSIDYNDMIVKIQIASTFLGTPLPGSIALFAGGLGLLGFAGFRKREKRSASVSSLAALA